ncbi:hypothetical protein [Nocardia sp. bgisy134]|uniref:hypothetical protein n=1 Tax=Nocardia sp. bgisy134 TaxID=3413789 RepID=UPI003D70F118
MAQLERLRTGHGLLAHRDAHHAVSDSAVGELERRDRRERQRACRTIDRERWQADQRDVAVDQSLDILHVLRQILATRANGPKNHHRTSLCISETVPNRSTAIATLLMRQASIASSALLECHSAPPALNASPNAFSRLSPQQPSRKLPVAFRVLRSSDVQPTTPVVRELPVILREKRPVLMSLASQLTTAVPALAAGVLALGSAVYSVRSTTRTSKDVEVLKAKLVQEAAAAEARRNLEYQARAKIYAESEPLVLKLAESADYAASRIIGLSEPRRWPALQATVDSSTSWMLSRSSEVISTVHALLEPLALLTLLREKTNFVDLAYERRLFEIYALARGAYNAHLDDYAIAEIPPAHTYDPVVPGWREKRVENPATYWWQGITRGRLDPAIEVCINREADRAATVDEFETRYIDLFNRPDDSRHKSLGLFCNPIYNFRPEDRPVFWRILLCQLLIYRRLSKRSRVSGEVAMSAGLDFDHKDIDQLRRSNAISDELFESSITAAVDYTNRILVRNE